jgi:membrane protease YdiL (CAAX protease family)
VSVPQRPDRSTPPTPPPATIPPRPDLPGPGTAARGLPPPGLPGPDGSGAAFVAPRPPVMPAEPVSRPLALAPVPWKWWESLVVAVVAMYFVGGIVAAIVVGTRGVADLSPFEFTVLGIGLQLGILGTVAGWMSVLHRGSWWRLDLRLRRARDLIVGAGVGLALVVISVVGVTIPLVLLLEAITGQQLEQPAQIPEEPVGVEILLLAIPVIVGAPIVEEILFRGVLFRGFRSRWGFAPAAGVSAALFGLAHYSVDVRAVDNLLLVVPLTVVGFGLAWLYERRANLLACMVAHAAFNVVGLLLLLLA